MFETFNGLPLHPLLVHAVVVLVPLLVLAALAYVLVPKLRTRLGWVLVSLAVVAPLAAFFAKQSGDAFKARLIRKKLTSDTILAQINDHQSYGQKLFFAAIALGVLALLLTYLTGRRRLPAAGSVVLNVVVVAVAVVTAFYTFKTGDTGAKAVWSGY